MPMGAHGIVIGIVLLFGRGILIQVPSISALPAQTLGPGKAPPLPGTPGNLPEGSVGPGALPDPSEGDLVSRNAPLGREGKAGTTPNPTPRLLATVAGLTPATPSLPPRGQGSSLTRLQDEEEEAMTTVVSMATVTTAQAPGPCDMRMVIVEGVMESQDVTSSPLTPGLDCTFIVSAYPGYGLQLEVRSLSLLEGEVLTVESLLQDESVILVNEAGISEGQIIRSLTPGVLIHFQSSQSPERGAFTLHCRAYPLSCIMPDQPLYGEVHISHLYPGGSATFRCNPGFELKGAMILTCLNLTTPQWNSPAPQCLAVCGATIPNATIGHILAPDYSRNHGNNLTCHWLIQAPEGQRIHLHFERLSLDEDSDRLIIHSGNFPGAPLVFHSDIDDVPERGVVSDSRDLFIELLSENSGFPPLLSLRYEAFDRKHCYPPFVAHGNYSTSDPSMAVGTRVEFQCHGGYNLKEGAPNAECVNPENPQWDHVEPVCQATCGGELVERSGVIFSPEWGVGSRQEGECVWYLHVPQDMRVVLQIQILNVPPGDTLSIYDGSDLNSRILGQYMGRLKGLRLFSTSSDVTVQLQSESESEGAPSAEGQGFIIHFAETLRNDTCQPLGPITNGWKTVSHSNLIRGTVVTYQCEPGYDIVGSEILTCQWDLSWSNTPPSCMKMSQELCSNPGVPENGYQALYKRGYGPGESLWFYCYEGFQMVGSSTTTCLWESPPRWSSPAPFCKVNYEELYDERQLQVSRTTEPSNQMEGGNIVMAILVPIFLVMATIGGIYLYYSKYQGKSLLHLPVSQSPSYRPLTTESDHHNPLYQSGDTQEYEVSI